MKIKWSDVALVDLLSIHDFLQKDSPVYAKHLSERILDAVEKLATFPEMGRWVPEAGKSDIRELVVQSYRIMYQISRDRELVLILAVVHGKRDISGQTPKPWDIV